MKINSCEVFTWYILSIRILGGGVEIKENLFKHNLANTASAIEKWPFGNSAPNRIFYIISLRLFFALAKTAIITHNTVAYARGPLWQACKNQGIIFTYAKCTEERKNNKNEKIFASEETPMTEIMAAVCPHPLKNWRYWVCYLGIAILFWKLVTEEFFSNVLMF